MFYRVTNAVIAPDLTRDLGLNAETLGILGGAFFYSFAIMQIPMGLLLDRVGPRPVMVIFSFIGACGAFLFGLSTTFAAALAGRILLGAGMASVLMGSLKVFVLRYPPRRFSTLSGLMVSVGTLGNILATSPLALLNQAVGWRLTFFGAGAVTTLLSVLIFWVLREDVPGSARPPADTGGPAHRHDRGRARLILGSLSFWQIGLVAFMRYGTFVALQGLWLGPYLMSLKGFPAVEAGNLILMISIGVIVGSPLAGFLADRIFPSAKHAIVAGLVLYLLCLGLLTGIWDVGGPFAYSVLFVVMGFASSFGTLAYTHVKELYPLTMSATAISAVNFFVMSGGAFFMQILGTIIETVTERGAAYPAEPYDLSFLLCFVLMAVSLAFYTFSGTKKKG